MKFFRLMVCFIALFFIKNLNVHCATNTNIVIFSLDYATVVNEKYTFLTSIKYSYEEYPEFLYAEYVTKSLRGVPFKYDIGSSGFSKIFLRDGGYVVSYKVSFKQGDLRIKESFSNDKNKGFSLKISYSDGRITNYSSEFIQVLDIPSLLFFLSKSDLDYVLNYNIFYGGSITNLYATNINSLEYSWDEEKKNFLRFKKISDKLVIDRFRFEGVTLGIFTNATIEGRLFDAKVIYENMILSNK
ncbi:MAG: hypothetical protein ACP5PT_07840 [Brevinematia bacterium]